MREKERRGHKDDPEYRKSITLEHSLVDNFSNENSLLLEKSSSNTVRNSLFYKIARFFRKEAMKEDNVTQLNDNSVRERASKRV